MLQGVQAEGDEIGGVGDAYHPEHAAFLAQFVLVAGVAHRVEVERMGRGHVLVGQGAAPNPWTLGP